MDCRLSRREMLRFPTVVLPTALFGYKVIDYFDEELVCVHVYGLSQKLPDPLLKEMKNLKNALKVGPIFKDPSKPPYLCSYPSQQKGFKKKPPIGGGYKMRALA